jgi:protein-disulfide isomerase
VAVSAPTSSQRLDRLVRNPLALALALAVVAAIVLAVVSVLGSQGTKRAADAPLAGIGEARATFAGVPQQGFALGSPSAKLTIEEYADLQCPYCQRFALDVLPLVVDRYVRTGKARLVFRPLAFIGDDSVRAGRFVAAAGQQGKLWQLVELLYRNQGGENTGWASGDLLDNAGRAVGLDVARADAYAQGDASAGTLRTVAERGDSLGVRSTPTLVLIRSGHAPQLANNALDTTALFALLDDALP